MLHFPRRESGISRFERVAWRLVWVFFSNVGGCTSSPSLSALPADVFRSPHDDTTCLCNFMHDTTSPHYRRHRLMSQANTAALPSKHFRLDPLFKLHLTLAASRSTLPSQPYRLFASQTAQFDAPINRRSTPIRSLSTWHTLRLGV